MSELIDRQALKDYVSSLSTHPLNEWDTWGVLAAIDKQPTIAASPWHRVEEGLPKDKQYVLFVVHTPPYHSTEFGNIPDMKKVVYGHFSLSQSCGRRYWSWEDEIGECVVVNEFVEEEDGERTYITHWMPLPEPPKEDA